MENQARQPASSLFLNVLCILTFSGTLVDVLMSVIGAGLSGGMNSHFLYSWVGAYLAGSLMCSGAAIFMILQKRIGFYLYLAAQVLCVWALSCNWMNQQHSIAVSPGTNQYVFHVVIIAAFIVMYAFNFRQLKKQS